MATVTVIGSGDQIVVGNGVTVIDDGTDNIITTGTNASVTEDGTGSGVWIGSGSTATVSGAGSYAVGETGATDDNVTLDGTGTSADWLTNSTLTVNGTNNGGWLGDGDTIVATSASAGMNIGTGTGGTVTENGTNDNIWIDGTSTVTVNGAGSIVQAEGGATQDDVTLAGTNEIGIIGNNGSVTATGGNAQVLIGGTSTAIMNGTGGYAAGLSGATDDTVTLNGNGVAAYDLDGSTLVVDGTDESGNIGNADSVTVNWQASGLNLTTGTGAIIYEYGSGNTITAGATATVSDNGTGNTVMLTGGGNTLTASGDVFYIGANGTADISGWGDTIDETGTWAVVSIDGNNNSVIAVALTMAYFSGTDENFFGSGGTIYETTAGTSVTVYGSYDTVDAADGTTTGFTGTQENLIGDDDIVYMDDGTASVTVYGNEDVVNSGYAGNVVGFDGNDDTVQINSGQIYLGDGSTSVVVEGNSDTVNSGYSGDTVGFTGTNEIAQISNGTIDFNSNSVFSVNIQGTGDAWVYVPGTTQSYPVLGEQTVSDIDAIYNAVLDRDAAPADLIAAQIVLANGGGLGAVMSAVANSAEAQADMDSTYAAEGAAPPSQAEFSAFADAMSTSYGAPMEVFSVDPNTEQQTELADTSITNLLAELPVLETEANGVNLGLQLADGTQVQFSSTDRLADFLYAVAVQQGQATQFVTDNYNLDMQWLDTIDQPLLNEAVDWSEVSALCSAAASAEQGLSTPTAAVAAFIAGTPQWGPADYTQLAAEFNTEADLALVIASEAPGSRQDAVEDIANPVKGNPTQITVYADGGGGQIHDLAPSPWDYVESAISTVIEIAAVVTGNAYLYFAAAAIDAAEAGQDLSEGQILPGIISLAEAVAGGITGAAGGTSPTQAAPVTAQIINAAAEGVGGVYGIVTSAENGDAAGILAGALEAAAAGAAGLGIESGGQTQQTLNLISTALGAASVATNMASDFASGNLAQGLVDSLNLYLPALALANTTDQTNQTDASAGLEDDYQAIANAYAQYNASQSATTGAEDPIAAGLAAALPAPTSSGDQTGTSAAQYSFSINTAAFAADITASAANGVPDFSNAISQLPAAATPPGGYATITTFDSTTWQFTFASGTDSTIDVTAQQVGGTTPSGGQGTSDTIPAQQAGIADYLWTFLGNFNPIGTAEAAGNGTALQPVVVQNPGQYVGDPLFWHNGATWCVALPEDVSSVGPTSGWNQGDAVTQETPAGTIIAIFNNPAGTAPGAYTNTPNYSHTAIVIGPDGNGGVWVAEQYPGLYSVIQTDFTLGNPSFLKNLSNYNVVLVH